MLRIKKSSIFYRIAGCEPDLPPPSGGIFVARLFGVAIIAVCAVGLIAFATMAMGLIIQSFANVETYPLNMVRDFKAGLPGWIIITAIALTLRFLSRSITFID